MLDSLISTLDTRYPRVGKLGFRRSAEGVAGVQVDKGSTARFDWYHAFLSRHQAHTAQATTRQSDGGFGVHTS